MRSWPVGTRAVRSLAYVSLIALSTSTPVACASAQASVDPILRVRLEGSPARRRVGTVLRITPESVFVRLAYTERHTPRFADLVFWGTQRLLVDPPRTVHCCETFAVARTDVLALERRGERRVWPFVAISGGLFAVGGMAVYWGGVTPVTVPVHAALTFGGALLGRKIGRNIGQHRWHPVPPTDWDRLPP